MASKPPAAAAPSPQLALPELPGTDKSQPPGSSLRDPALCQWPLAPTRLDWLSLRGFLPFGGRLAKRFQLNGWRAAGSRASGAGGKIAFIFRVFEVGKFPPPLPVASQLRAEFALREPVAEPASHLLPPLSLSPVPDTSLKGSNAKRGNPGARPRAR